jgi:hypothetical protein
LVLWPKWWSTCQQVQGPEFNLLYHKRIKKKKKMKGLRDSSVAERAKQT